MRTGEGKGGAQLALLGEGAPSAWGVGPALSEGSGRTGPAASESLEGPVATAAAAVEQKARPAQRRLSGSLSA